MSIASRLFGQVRSLLVPGGHPRDPGVIAMLGGGMRSAAGISVTAESAGALTGAHACIRILSSSFACMPLDLYKLDSAGDRQKDIQDPLYRLIHLQPNSLQTSYEWRELLMAQLLLRGNHYSLLIDNRAGETEEILPLNPDRCLPFIAPNGKIAYRYNDPVDGKTKIYLDYEILHVKGWSLGGLCGVDPVQYHRDTFGLALATKEHASNFFKNGTVASGILQTDEQLSDEAFQRLRQDWANRQSGSSQFEKPIILEEGLKWETMGMEPKSAQLIDAMKLQLSDMGRIYGVPGAMYNDTDGSSNWGTGVEAQTMGF